MNSFKVTGKPIIYKGADGQPCSYPVEDGLGPAFMETMLPGVANDRSGERDALFLVNHGAGGTLPLARESAGTLRLEDTPTALTFNADLDASSTLASDLASAIARKDLTQMSVGFRVLDDEWSADYMNRTVRAIELLDVSPVNQPASPTTTISLVPPETAKKKKLDDEFGGPDGSQNAPYPYGGTMGGDGTGTRDKSRWSSAERRAGARAGGVEQRAQLRGSLEVRAFTVWAPRPAVVPVVAPVRKRNSALTPRARPVQAPPPRSAAPQECEVQRRAEAGHAENRQRHRVTCDRPGIVPDQGSRGRADTIKAVPLGAADERQDPRPHHQERSEDRSVAPCPAQLGRRWLAQVVSRA